MKLEKLESRIAQLERDYKFLAIRHENLLNARLKLLNELAHDIGKIDKLYSDFYGVDVDDDKKGDLFMTTSIDDES